MGNQAGFPTLLAQPRRWDVISGMMLELNLKTLVEVGAKEGRTTGHILKTVPDSRVIAIDPWCAMPDQKDVKGGETYEAWDFAKIEAQFWENVGTPGNDSEGRPRCTMLKMTSEQAASGELCAPIGNVDCIFIDAAHDYTNVMKDIRLWWPKIREGGLLVAHDYNHKWPGVERAAADSFDLMRVGVAPDSVWFVLKTGDTDVRP